MVAMPVEWTELPGDRPLTVEDLKLLPDDGRRYELDDGLLVVSPGPIIGHQVVVDRLCEALRLRCPKDLFVVTGGGIELNPSQYRIPDLMVFRAGDVGFYDTSTTKPPVLAVEVASPSTALYDRNRKKDVYASFGIASYWIVRPDLRKPGITVFELSRRAYRQVAEVNGDEVFRSKFPFPCEIVPSELVAGPWED